jgi:two-component system, cell cycle sensor histidine kinase and response regulator CckA
MNEQGGKQGLELFRGDETILLVEDEAGLRSVVARSLRMLGYRVLEATDALEAIGIWNEQRGGFDLLLSDICLPGSINGMALGQRLRGLKPTLKIILSTGFNSETTTEALPNQGPMLCLQKPYEMKVLSKAVRNCLDGH